MLGFYQGTNNLRNTPAIQAGALVDRPSTAVGVPNQVFLDWTTPSIQQLVSGSWLTLASAAPAAGTILQGGNTFGVPMNIGTIDNQNVLIKTNNVTRFTLTNTTATFTGQLISDSLLNTNTVGFRGATTAANASMCLVSSGLHVTSLNVAAVVIGAGISHNNSLQSVIVGAFSTISAGIRHAITGYGNTFTNGDSCVIAGNSNTINYVSDGVSGTPIILGASNTVTHKYSIAIGSNLQTTAENQLIIANSLSNVGGFNDVYFGTGPRSFTSNRVGTAVVINGSGAGVQADTVGGNLTLASGKGTGNATATDLIFQTPDVGASGSTLQALTTRLTIKGTTGKAEFSNTIKTGTFGAGAGEWKLGTLVTAAVTPDITRYLEVQIAGVTYKVIIST